MINYITIEREYGSGATEIGRRLHEATGIKCYGGEILELAAKKMGVSVEEILDIEEKSVDSLSFAFNMVEKAAKGEGADVPNSMKLHTIEDQIIRDLADEGPAVFIGHCASNALKDRDDVLSVYIHGSKTFNRFRAIEKYHISPSEVDKITDQINKRRNNYYYSTTGKKIDNINNYGLVLDSSILGIKTCVDILADAIKI